MDNRLYFIVGDLLSALSSGLLAALACAAIFSTSWAMLPAMLIGMIIGMAIATILGFILLRYFGAMELMVPVMLSGMTSGMFVSMAAAMQLFSWQKASAWGLTIGLFCLLFCWFMNARLRGPIYYRSDQNMDQNDGIRG